MRKLFSRSAVLGAAALIACFLNACDTSSSSEDECALGEEMNECEENAGRCDAGNTYICERDEFSCLKWRLDATNLLQCKVEETCTVGQSRCIGNTVQTCSLNASGRAEWVNGETCQFSCSDGSCASGASICYLENAVQCSGNTVQTCARNAAGILEWTNTETCPVACSEGVCTSCSDACTPDTYRCVGKGLQKCVKNGACAAWEPQKTCEASCRAEFKTCMEDLPTCKLKPGSKGTILQWTDGDTLWVRAESDGTCNDYEYTADSKGNYAWRNVRYRIRVEGIDAPECEKARNQYYYYVCIQSSSWNAKNERFGYESWVAASKMIPYQSRVTFSCEKTRTDGACDYDTTYSEDQEQEPRHVAYVGFEKNNASYDFSTELAREGMAFANTESKFVKGTTKLRDICKAQREAQNSKLGLWSLADSTAEVLSMMSRSKQIALKYLDSTCNNLMK